jgi:hypothetical protein
MRWIIPPAATDELSRLNATREPKPRRALTLWDAAEDTEPVPPILSFTAAIAVAVGTGERGRGVIQRLFSPDANGWLTGTVVGPLGPTYGRVGLRVQQRILQSNCGVLDEVHFPSTESSDPWGPLLEIVARTQPTLRTLDTQDAGLLERGNMLSTAVTVWAPHLRVWRLGLGTSEASSLALRHLPRCAALEELHVGLVGPSSYRDATRAGRLDGSMGFIPPQVSFHAVLGTPATYAHLRQATLLDGVLSEGALLALASRAPRLTHLTLSECRDITVAAWREGLSQLELLESLALSSCSDAVIALGSLSRVSVPGDRASGTPANNPAKKNFLPHLRALTVCNFDAEEEDEVAEQGEEDARAEGALARALNPWCGQLQHLTLQRCNEVEEDEAAPNTPNVATWIEAACRGSVRAARTLPPPLSRCVTLCLSHVFPTVSDARLATLLRCMPLLRELELRRNRAIRFSRAAFIEPATPTMRVGGGPTSHFYTSNYAAVAGALVDPANTNPSGTPLATLAASYVAGVAALTASAKLVAPASANIDPSDSSRTDDIALDMPVFANLRVLKVPSCGISAESIPTISDLFPRLRDLDVAHTTVELTNVLDLVFGAGSKRRRGVAGTAADSRRLLLGQLRHLRVGTSLLNTGTTLVSELNAAGISVTFSP